MRILVKSSHHLFLLSLQETGLSEGEKTHFMEDFSDVLHIRRGLLMSFGMRLIKVISR